MDKQNLIIFKYNAFYNIMKELEENLNLKIFEASNEQVLNKIKDNLKNYIIITSKKITNINDALPNTVKKMLEEIAPQKPKKFVISDLPTNLPIPGSFGL